MDLDAVILTHREPLERHLRRRVGDAGLAEDLAQEVFLRAWQHAPRGLTEPRLRAWLYRVAGNLAIDTLRARRPHDEAALLDSIGAVAAVASSDQDERLALDAALERLSPRDRALVTLQFSGFGPTEVAALLETTPEAARKRLARARERFRVVYADLAPAEEAPLVLLVARDHDPADYVRWLEAGGLRVRHVAAEDAPRQLATAHALVLTGSHRDLHPSLYGQAQRAAQNPSLAVDRADVAVVREALATRMPVLGICRGHQLINVVRGGTLHQDLAELRSSAAGHAGGAHVVGTREGTLVRRVLGARASVPSFHHQAIDRLGHGLHVASRSGDGVIEAVEDPRLPFAVGVQWHAEVPDADVAGRRLRDALADAARRQAGGALPVAA
ncbi:MAG: putative polymerase, sigma 70 family subunit [Conexibacter sp.]|nr:putative polymerase, sigma 70 family subunit [Conexibacter sp.]